MRPASTAAAIRLVIVLRCFSLSLKRSRKRGVGERLGWTRTAARRAGNSLDALGHVHVRKARGAHSVTRKALSSARSCSGGSP
jgi:DNA-binding FadR family transcriptional regulator